MLKSRSGSQGSPSATAPQTIEVVRRRARNRLIGAAILVLVGVLGFPLLFDTEPRPVAGDVRIEIPARGDTSAMLSKAPAASDDAEPATKPATKPVEPVARPTEQAKSESALTAKEGLDARETVVEPVDRAEPVKAAATKEPVAEKKLVTKAMEAVQANDQAKTQAADQAKLKAAQAAASKEKTESAAADSARAKALLEGKAPAGNERLVVQVGAFSDAVAARTTRLKVERAGMTTYTHVADTPSGKLIRVRVGPFGSRAEADKAAGKLKALGLPARILAL